MVPAIDGAFRDHARNQLDLGLAGHGFFVLLIFRNQAAHHDGASVDHFLFDDPAGDDGHVAHDRGLAQRPFQHAQACIDEIAAQASAANKFQLVSFKLDFSVPFTFWAGLLGGTFLTMASHGTDQLLVQRLLTCRNQRDSQKAIILSGFVVLFQFALFLTIGVMLYAYYKSYPLTTKLASNDEIFPTFIVHRLPHGVSGLVIAAIFAAAMSNLSGSLNSLSSSTVLDFYKPLIKPQATDGELLKLSRWLTAAWGIVLIGIAIVASSWGSVFTTGLTIASLVYGPMLGAFLLGVLTKRANQKGVMVGMATTLVIMIFIKFNGVVLQWASEKYQFQPTAWMDWLAVHTNIAWTWYVLIGTIICSSIGYVTSLLTKTKQTDFATAES